MEETFDFIVVGSGGGSMCAALLARSLGKSALILEKTDKLGGTTSMSGGVMWLPNNRFMKQDGIADSDEKALTYLENLVGNDLPGTPRVRKQAYITEGQRMVDFLLSQGIKLRRIKYYPDYYDDAPGGSAESRAVIAEIFDANALGEWADKLRPGFRRMPAALDEMMMMGNFKNSWRSKLLIFRVGLRMMKARLLGQRWVNGGECLQARMLQASLKAGVDIRLEAGVKQLLTDDSGRVTGVVATIDGRDRVIGARLGVLINAGGYARNQRLRDKFRPGSSVHWTNANPGDTGEMLEEGIRIGAAIGHMDQLLGTPMAIPPGQSDDEMHPMSQTDMSKPHSILVDQTGVRYMREAVSYMEICQNMFARNQEVPAIPSWLIFDSNYIEKYMVAGTMPGANKPQAWFDNGFFRKADSIAELAKVCAIDPAVLTATVDRFNGFVRNNRDEDFHRGEREYDRFVGDPEHEPSPTMGTIERGPFYAVQIVPGDLGTLGGFVTDEFARVKREDGSVIEGLYATGNSTASVMGTFYPGAGSTVGPSFVWGYVAAKHAANADNLAAAAQ
jgi:3-oxosteroid 1-dehydrogenase